MRRAARQAVSWAGPLSALLSTGCGGGAALLHPAHTLAESRVTLGAGASGQFAFGEAERAIETGRSVTTPGVSAETDGERAYVAGAVAQAMIAPGVSPWIGARAGLGGKNDAGITYVGRSLRIDGRHAWESKKYAFSAGLGASAILLRPGSVARTSESDDLAPGVGRFAGGVDDPAATGWGLDLPLLVGYRSTGDVVQLWAGARGGIDFASVELPLRINSNVPLGAPGSEVDVSAGASRWYAGGLMGLAVGIHPLWVALELQAAFVSVSGTAELPESFGDPREIHADLTGWTLTPAGAIIAKF